MVKTRKKQHDPSYVHDSPNFWACVTILIFPVAMLGALSLGYSSASAFLLGMYSTIAALVANVVVEKHLWMFHPRWQAILENPEFSYKLAIVTGAILLVLQTTLLVFIFTEPSFDRSVLRLVFDRQCSEGYYGFYDFCQALERALVSAP